MTWGEIIKLAGVFAVGAIFGLVLAMWLVIPTIWERKDRRAKKPNGPSNISPLRTGTARR